MRTTRSDNKSLAYLNHFGLQQNPFPVAPDDANFYLSATIEEIIAEIVHGVSARKGFIMLTGGVGLGKTTITRRILKIIESKQILTSLVFHTSLKDADLLREINRDFGLPVDTSDNGDQLGNRLQQLNDFLVEQYGQGKNCVIIIDDAQNLDRSSLELVRMISNLEVDQQKIVQILLVGQTELMVTLKSRAMRQLYSRIVIRKVVRSLSREELRSYIQFKLNTAGNQGRIALTSFAYRKLFRLSKGNFRSVNLLMDRCLYTICLGGGYRITRRIINAAFDDLNPEKNIIQKRFLVWATSILVPMVIAVGSWAAHFHTVRNSMANDAMVADTHKVPQQLPMIASNAVTAIAPRPAIPAGLAETSHADAAVSAFLSIYQLERYESEFQKAIEMGFLESISRRIYGETGYQLIRLSFVPDQIRKQYGALAFTLGAKQSTDWLLFWRPQLELRRFYYNYRGEEIYKLQKLLSELHYYQYKVDGIVGQRLMNAVISFQKSAGLPLTGFPDPVTLFWVCHQQEIVSNG